MKKAHSKLHQSLLFIATASAALALGACNKDASNDANMNVPPPSATVMAPTTAPDSMGTAASAVSVASVDLGSQVDANNRISAASTSFAPNDTIYATVMTHGNGAAKLDAKWTYQDGRVVHEDTKTINANGDEATSFMVSKPSGFPAGSYKVEVMLNGAQVASKDFSVK